MLKLLIKEFLFFAISVFDITFNIKAQDFPKYHDLRIKFNIIALIFEVLSFLIIIFLFCSFKYIFYILLIFGFITYLFMILGVYYLIKSFYLYFAYDGFHRIKNPAIHILMYISLIKFIFGICSKNSSTKYNRSNNVTNNEAKKEYNESKKESNESNESNEANESKNEINDSNNESIDKSDKIKIVVYNN